MKICNTKKLCKCGCKKLIVQNKWTGKYADRIRGHYERDIKHKSKMRIIKFGHEVNDKTRLKISKTLKKKKITAGKNNPMYGKRGKLCPNYGKKNGRWLGGKSISPYGFDFDKELRKLIRKRDNNKCRFCSKRKYKREHDVHHIDYDKINNNPDNLITLCRQCHMKTNTNSRIKWTRLFQRMMKFKIKIIK